MYCQLTIFIVEDQIISDRYLLGPDSTGNLLRVKAFIGCVNELSQPKIYNMDVYIFSRPAQAKK